MLVLAGAEEAAGQDQHPEFASQRLGDRLGRPVRDGMAHIGEIGADLVELPARQAGKGGAEDVCPSCDLVAVCVAPVGQFINGPGQCRLSRAGRADLDAVNDLFQLGDGRLAGDHGAHPVAGNGVGFGE